MIMRRYLASSRWTPRLCWVLALVLAGCGMASDTAGQISERIGAAVRAPDSRELNLATLTSFGWDRLFLFKAGTPRSVLCRFIGAKRHQCGRIVRFDVVPEGHGALVFALDGQLTHLELHSRANGRFDVDVPEQGLARDRCRFRVRHVASVGAEPDAVLELM